jgi:hypothetical protein
MGHLCEITTCDLPSFCYLKWELHQPLMPHRNDTNISAAQKGFPALWIRDSQLSQSRNNMPGFLLIAKASINGLVQGKSSGNHGFTMTYRVSFKISDHPIL